jgi:hypothetical protein
LREAVVVSARAIASAETDLRKAEQAAIHARTALQKASVRDGRLMSLMPSNDPRRKTFEEASRNAVVAERAAQECRGRLERLRSANGGGKPNVKQARMTLEAAILAAKRATSAAQKNRAAIEQGLDASIAATKRIEAAERKVEQAGEDDIDAAAKAVAAGRLPPAPGLEKARAKVQEAEEARERIRVGRQRLEERQAEFDGVAANAKAAVESAINGVLRAEVPLEQLMAQVSTLTDQLAAAQLVLLHWRSFVDAQEKEQVNAVLRERLPGMLGELVQYPEHPVTQRINALRQALAADASAEVDLRN